MSESMPQAAVGDRSRPWSKVVFGVALVLGAAAVSAAVLGRPSPEPKPASATEAPRAQSIPVRVTPATTQTLTLTGEYTGELDSDVAEIAARTAGLLERVDKRIGDPVDKGQLLASVDASEAKKQLVEIEAQIRIAESARSRSAAQLGAVERQLARTEPLLEDRLVSPQEVDEIRSLLEARVAESQSAEAEIAQGKARAEVLREQIRFSRLLSPFRGRVAERHLDPGTVVQPGTPVVRVVADGPLRVRFRIPEHDLGRVAPEMAFSITTQATGQEVFTGKVTRLSAEVSPADRSVAVEGMLDSSHEVLRRGMFVRVQVTLGTIDDAITVPGEAVVERISPTGEMAVGVFVAEGGTATLIPVEVRGRAEDEVAIEGAIAPGTPVVVVGQDKLRDGAPVRVVGSSE